MGNGYWDFFDKNYKENKSDQHTKENCEKVRRGWADKKVSNSSFMDEVIIESEDFQEEYEVEEPNEIDIPRKFVKHHLRKNLKQLQINISMVIFIVATYDLNRKDEVLSFYNEVTKDINFATLDLCDNPVTIERLLQSIDSIYAKVNNFLRQHCCDSENMKENKELFDLAQRIVHDVKQMKNTGSNEQGSRDFRFIDI